MLIDIIAGARPNFMKIAPIISAIKEKQKIPLDISYRLIHTGQHYDQKMSGDFFQQLGIPEPEVNLGAGGGTQSEQTAAIMIGYEKVLMLKVPDLVMVVGDVTSTMACSITAKKFSNIKVAHIEAGIRSGDLTMPEEINRMVTDSITDYFFTTSRTANENLLQINVKQEHIFFVGNTMIDTLLLQIKNFRKPKIWDENNLKKNGYVVMTLHRPSNVDDHEKLQELINVIVESSKDLPIIFPVHPRTAKTLKSLGISASNLILTDPMSYLEFNYLIQYAKAVITDSGGITEETTVLHIPCMTLRENTERPETCSIGTNVLLGTDPKAISHSFDQLHDNKWKKGSIPELWDGNAAKRIINTLIEIFSLDK